jgi:translocation protein SEC63
MLMFHAFAELENTAPRIKSDFKPEHADLVDAQKRKRLRKERRIKRIITVILGYVVMAWMIYLIMVTSRTTTKAYDPYDILGVARVCFAMPLPATRITFLFFLWESLC